MTALESDANARHIYIEEQQILYNKPNTIIKSV